MLLKSPGGRLLKAPSGALLTADAANNPVDPPPPDPVDPTDPTDPVYDGPFDVAVYDPAAFDV